MASAPRWKTAIETALSKNEKSTVIQLSTVSAERPYARSHIFRSFLSSISKPSLPVILSSTDIRTPKVAQILANPFVEVAWWIEGTKEQYRVFGKASIVPSPDHNAYDTCMKMGVHLAPSESQHANAGLGMTYSSLVMETGFDWEAKRVEVFKTMSAHMKASWCRPTPGSKMLGGYDDAKEWPERVEEPSSDDPDHEKKLQLWNMALRNFALVLIDPLEVDYAELGVVPNRRTRFWRQVTKDGSVDWQEEAVVP